MGAQGPSALVVSPSDITNFDAFDKLPKSVVISGGLAPYSAASSDASVCSVVQGVSPNLYPNADSLSGVTLTGLTLASGGPGGAADAEYTGTGSAISSSLEMKSAAIPVSPGSAYIPSCQIDPSNITHGAIDFRVLKASDGSVLYDAAFSPSGFAARFNVPAWTCPAGVTSVFCDVFCSSSQSGGFIVANGQTLKFSQPMFTPSGIDPSVYQSPTNTWLITPKYRGKAAITFMDSTP
jgi:hypothetical protein